MKNIKLIIEYEGTNYAGWQIQNNLSTVEGELKKAIEITTSIEDCISSIEKYFKAGFTTVYVHSTSPDEIEFLDELPRNASGKVLKHTLRKEVKSIVNE